MHYLYKHNIDLEYFGRLSLFVNGVYNIQNIRRHGHPVGMSRAVDVAKSLLFEAARGHPACRKIAARVLLHIHHHLLLVFSRVIL